MEMTSSTLNNFVYCLVDFRQRAASLRLVETQDTSGPADADGSPAEGQTFRIPCATLLS